MDEISGDAAKSSKRPSNENRIPPLSPALSGVGKPLGSAPVEASSFGGIMRRHAVAFLFILSCVLAGSVQAAEIRFPKAGAPAFLVNLPTGWTAKEDRYNGMQLLPADHRSSIYLSMVRDQNYAGKPLMELALAIGKPSNITQFPKQEPAAVSGKKGEVFFGQMKNASGILLDVKMIIIPLEPDLWATETLLISQQINAAQTAALNQAVRGVTLTGLK